MAEGVLVDAAPDIVDAFGGEADGVEVVNGASPSTSPMAVA